MLAARTRPGHPPKGTTVARQRAGAAPEVGATEGAGATAGSRATPAIIRSLNCPSAMLIVAGSVAGQAPLDGTSIDSFTGCAFAGGDCFKVQAARNVTLHEPSP